MNAKMLKKLSLRSFCQILGTNNCCFSFLPHQYSFILPVYFFIIFFSVCGIYLICVKRVVSSNDIVRQMCYIYVFNLPWFKQMLISASYKVLIAFRCRKRWSLVADGLKS